MSSLAARVTAPAFALLSLVAITGCDGAGRGGPPGSSASAIITEGKCPEGEIDVCENITLADLTDGCYHPVSDPKKRQDLICTRQCVKADAPAAERKCNIIVTGATQDQCPPIPGCCLRLSSPDNDISTEFQICDLADSLGKCPTKGKGQCDATDCGKKVDGKVNWTCHSLGGAWCNCNGLGGRDAHFIGTRCPRDAEGKPCAGKGCCLSIDGPKCSDPVPYCIECCCDGKAPEGGDFSRVKCAAGCLNTPGDYLGDKGVGDWSIDCHEHVDYSTCLKKGVTIGDKENQCGGIFPRPPAGEEGAVVVCKPATPIKGTDKCVNKNVGAMGTGRLVCSCENQTYCGDYFTPCCKNKWGVTDGCGPCQECKTNMGDPKGTGICMPIITDKPKPACVPAESDIHQTCIGPPYVDKWVCVLPPGCKADPKYPTPPIITCTVPCTITQPKPQCPDSIEVIYEKGKKPVYKGKCCEPEKPEGQCAPPQDDPPPPPPPPGPEPQLNDRYNVLQVIGIADAGVSVDCSGGVLPPPAACGDGVCELETLGGLWVGECQADCESPPEEPPPDLGPAVEDAAIEVVRAEAFVVNGQ